MEIKKFLNPKILKWAVLACRVVGLVYIFSDLIFLLILSFTPLNIFSSGTAFSLHKSIIADGLFSADAVLYLLVFLSRIFLGIVFYAFSFAFAALIDIADELESTI